MISPAEFCKRECQYRDTINCDYKLKCCPMWDYIYLNKQKK